MSAPFGDEARAHLASAGEPFALAAGEVLFRQGALADAAYLLNSGRLQISTRIPGDASTTVSEVGPGEVVGEAALLEDRPRSATVRAMEPCTGLRVPRLRFASLLADGWAPAAVLVDALCQLVARRIASAVVRIAADTRFEPTALRAPGSGAPTPAPPGDLGACLAGLPRLAELLPHAAELGPLGQWQRAPRGALLTAPDTMPAALLVVLRGALRSGFARPGGIEPLALYGPGEIAGLVPLLTGAAEPLRLEAAEDSLLLALGPASLAPLRTDPAPLGHALMAVIGRQLLRDQVRANRHVGRAAALAQFNAGGA